MIKILSFFELRKIIINVSYDYFVNTESNDPNRQSCHKHNHEDHHRTTVTYESNNQLSNLILINL